MPFPHEAVAALPVDGPASKALLRAMLTSRFIYCFDLDESVEDFVALDPESGAVPLYLLQNSTLYRYDATDTTTPHDGLTCLVTSDGLRYKYGDITIFLGLLTATDVGLGNVDNTSDDQKNAAVATLTNKTIDAAVNAILNLTTAAFAANVVDVDGSLAANSDSRIPTQKAVKTYADGLLAAADAMIFKGVIDCSANPNYPAADRGYTYKVSVAGKIGGGSGVVVELSDMVICITDGSASGNQASVGANWVVVQANLDGAMIGPASSTNNALALFNGTTGKILKDSAITVDADPTLSANSDSRIPTQKAVKDAITASGGGSASGHGQCRLDYVSATQIALTPFNGDKVLVAGAAIQIPAAGVTAANTGIYVDGVAGQNLAASTVYNVYLFSNSGTPTLDFSTTARAADTTAGNVGVQIKTGAASRSLVGKVETNASSQFASNMVISWFNRRRLRVANVDGSDRNASSIWTEVATGLRGRFLSWGTTEGVIRVSYAACLKHATAGTAMYIGAGLDGTTTVVGGQSATAPVANYYCALSTSVTSNVSEGAHYFTLVGGAGAGNTVFTGSNIASSLEVEYWG